MYIYLHLHRAQTYNEWENQIISNNNNNNEDVFENVSNKVYTLLMASYRMNEINVHWINVYQLLYTLILISKTFQIKPFNRNCEHVQKSLM